MPAVKPGGRGVRFVMVAILAFGLGPFGLTTVDAACTDCDADGFTFPTDCNDADPGVWPGATELCDGFDNDCNGIIDDNLTCKRLCLQLQKNAFDTLVSGDPAATSLQPSVAWTGNEYGVAWRDSRHLSTEIFFALISAAGVKLTADSRITSATGASSMPALVWTGTEFGVAWVDARDGNSEIYFNRIDMAGAPVGTDVRITSNAGFSGQPDLNWTGAEYAVVWTDDRDGNREIYFNRADETGLVAGSDVRVTTSGGVSEQPSLSWQGGSYGLAWTDERDGNREIYFNRLDTAGTPLGADVRIMCA